MNAVWQDQKSESIHPFAIRIEGEWIGYYKDRFDQVIKIERNGQVLTATKITGDDFVPAGEITWRANVSSGYGEGQVAEEEFRNPKFIPGRLTVLSSERIMFSWEGFGNVEYRKDF